MRQLSDRDEEGGKVGTLGGWNSIERGGSGRSKSLMLSLQYLDLL